MTDPRTPSTTDSAQPTARDDPDQDVPSTMRAIVQREYGGSDVLELADIDTPSPGDDEALVRVRAAAVNPADWHSMRGEPYFMRLQFGLGRSKVRGRGLDLAGQVVAVGEEVTAFEPGEEVFGSIDYTDQTNEYGTFAEYACLPVDLLARKPDTLSYEEAASIPLAGLTALQGLRQGGVEAETSVLINGASGGVGTIAVQIADSIGAEVTGVCSTRNVDLVRSLGADHVVDYTRTDFTKRDRQYDCVVDWVGNRSLSDLRRVLAPAGTLVLSGGEGGRWIGPLGTIVTAAVLDRFVSQELGLLSTGIDAHDLDELTDLLDNGTIGPVIDRTYDLEDSADAIGYVEEGHVRGKVVVAVSEPG